MLKFQLITLNKTVFLFLNFPETKQNFGNATLIYTAINNC